MRTWIYLWGVVLSCLASAPEASAQDRKELDLLGLVDASRDSVVGEWTRVDGALLSPQLMAAVLQVPYLPPREYDLAVTAERIGPPESLNLGLASGDSRFMVILDGWGGGTSGLHRLEGRDANANATTSRGTWFVPGKASRVLISVRVGGVLVSVNGTTIIDWKGDLRRLSGDENWRTPDRRALFLGSHETTYRFTRVILTPVGAEGKAIVEPPARTPKMGGIWGGLFEEVAPPGGLLIGLQASLGAYGPAEIVKTVQPIYRKEEREVRGRIHGRPSERSAESIARPGYAVGGMLAKGGHRLDGFRLLFMKVTPEGMNPNDSYEGEWIGGRGGCPEGRLGGAGRRIVGIFGQEGDDLGALGLCYAPGLISGAAGAAGIPEHEGVWLEGTRLSDAQARVLEGELGERPAALTVRLLLIAFHGQRAGEGAFSQGPFADLVVGLVERHPDSDLAFEYSRFLRPPVYEKGAAAWLAAAKSRPGEAKILGRAGAFLSSNPFVADYRSEGRALIEKAMALEPKNPEWPEQLAMSYNAELLGTPSRELAAKALGALENAYTLRPPEARMELRPEGRHAFHVLATLAFQAGDLRKATSYATDLLKSVSEREEGWNYGNAIHDANTILGRVALRESRPEDAKKFLLAAGRMPGSPQLDSFGPSMVLAEELLKKGDRDTVLKYLELCRKFWNNQDALKRLDEWVKAIEEGKSPDFGR